jgi:hypothetical protein
MSCGGPINGTGGHPVADLVFVAVAGALFVAFFALASALRRV